MRVAHAVVLDPTSRTELERLSRKRSLAARVVVRSRIILFAADGLQNQRIAAEPGVSTRTVALWRGPFLLLGIQGWRQRRSAPRAHAQNYSRSSSRSRCQGHANNTFQCHPVVHANNGPRSQYL